MPAIPDLLPGTLDLLILKRAPSDANRRARYYSLTRAGRKHLAAERREFESIVDAIRRVLETA